MSKESLTGIQKKAVFRETFSSEQTTRTLGGIPSGVTYINGVASCSVANASYIKYSQVFKGTYSIRIRLKSYTKVIGTNSFFIDYRSSTGAGAGYIFIDSTASYTISIPSGTIYVNGVATNVINNSTSTTEIIVTGITLASTDQYLNTRYSILNQCNNCDYELLEIYEGTLTAQEVKNIYENKRYDDLSNHGDVYGNELVTNGSFTPPGTGWITAGESTVNTGVGRVYTSAGVASHISQTILTVGKKYHVEFDVISTDGSNLADSSFSVSWGTTTIGHKVKDFTAVDTSLLFKRPGGPCDVSLDNITCKEILTNNTEILRVDGKNGTITNKYSGDGSIPNLVNTDVTVKRQGGIYTMDFNGSTSKLDAGSYDPMTGDKTFITWLKPRILDNNTGRIFDNGKLGVICVVTGVTVIRLYSDGLTFGATGTISPTIGIPILLIITRTSTGLTNFYINGVLSGTANQSSGTPAAGTTNLFIGSRLDGNRPWNGQISGTRIVNGILSVDEISQIFSNERRLYGI